MEIKQHQLYSYMDELYEQIPDDLACSIAEEAHIDLVEVNCEADELWSFVARKTNKQWLWLALDRNSRQVVALFVGDRSAKGALGLWQAIPERYRVTATANGLPFTLTTGKPISKSFLPINTSLARPKKVPTMRQAFLWKGSFVLFVSDVHAWFV